MKSFKKSVIKKVVEEPSEYVKMFAGIRKFDPDANTHSESEEYTKMFAGFFRKKKNKLKEDFEDSPHLYHKTPHELAKIGYDGASKIKKADRVHTKNPYFKPQHTVDQYNAPSHEMSKGNAHVSKLHDQLKDHYHFGAKRRSESNEHTQAITHYTEEHPNNESGYRKWNTALYHGALSKLNDTDHKMMGTLKDALKMHKTPHALTVYSGVSRSPERHAANAKGDHIKTEFPAFTSASIDRGRAKAFAQSDRQSEHIYDHSAAIAHVHNSGWQSADRDRKKFMRSNPPPKVAREDQTKGRHNYDYNHVISMKIPRGAHGAYAAHRSNSPGEKEFIMHPGTKFHIDKTPTLDHEKKMVHWNAKMVHDGVRDVEHLHDDPIVSRPKGTKFGEVSTKPLASTAKKPSKILSKIQGKLGMKVTAKEPEEKSLVPGTKEHFIHHMTKMSYHDNATGDEEKQIYHQKEVDKHYGKGAAEDAYFSHDLGKHYDENHGKKKKVKTEFSSANPMETNRVLGSKEHFVHHVTNLHDASANYINHSNTENATAVLTHDSAIKKHYGAAVAQGAGKIKDPAKHYDEHMSTKNVPGTEDHFMHHTTQMHHHHNAYMKSIATKAGSEITNKHATSYAHHFKELADVHGQEMAKSASVSTDHKKLWNNIKSWK